MYDVEEVMPCTGEGAHGLDAKTDHTVPFEKTFRQQASCKSYFASLNH